MRLHYFQHVLFEDLGCIEKWATGKGHRVTSTAFYTNGFFPDLETIDWLVIMGGPMNIYEEDKFPWLPEEKRFIRAAIAANKVVIGICLGAQLIADALGATVYKNRHKEIGWFPIIQTEASARHLFFPDGMEAFHWHGDTFDLPPGARHIARSKACENQAFIHGERVIGLQFHLELMKEGAKRLIENCRNELVDGPYIQTPAQMLSRELRFQDANSTMFDLLNRLPRA